MSLRRKDDWDEALEEAYYNGIEKGTIVPKPIFVKPNNYDYGMCIKVSYKELMGVEHAT